MDAKDGDPVGSVPARGRWTSRRPFATASPWYGRVGALALAALAISTLLALAACRAVLLAADLAALYVGAPCLAALAAWDHGRKAAQELRGYEDPPPRGVCLVEIDVRVGGASVGRDRGAAWIEGGRLLYDGARTSFALGGEDLVAGGSSWPRVRGVEARLRTGGRRAAVRIVPFARDRRDARRVAAFGRALRAFVERPAPSEGGPRQWPPFSRVA